MSTTRDRLAGLGATLLILLLVLGTPLLLIAIGVTPWHETLRDLGALLTSPDDGTLAILVVSALAWVAWAVMAVLFAIEIMAALRDVHAPRVPGLGMPQDYAGRLVAVAVLLLAVTPSAAPAFGPPAAGATPAAPAPRTSQLELPLSAEPESTQRPISTPPAAALESEPVAAVNYAVRRGDSLWKIANERLGDGTRYVEIVALNEHVLHGRPDFIAPGLVLRLPGDAATPPPVFERDEETRVVEPGDTLWDIAEDELGEGDRYPRIFEASRATLQPDGQRLIDPDLIRPGWELSIQQAAIADSPAAESRIAAPDRTDPPPIVPPAEKRPRPEQAAPPSDAFGDDSGPRHAEAQPSADSDAEASAVDWALPGFMGAGALLAGTVLLAVRSHRRTQQRYRRPGFTIASPPPELRAVEKTASQAGGPTADVVVQLDRLLRHLAAHADWIPRLDAIEIDQQTATLHLTSPTALPAPWTGSERTWTSDLDADIVDEDQLPPYPLLASVGQSEDGHLWLLDFERLGTATLTGDTERARALARHLAAELALSPWAIIAEIDTIDVAVELAPLVPGRLTHHDAGDTAFASRIHTDLTASQEVSFGDPEPFRVLLVAGAPSKEVRSLVDLVRGQTSRSGLAVVTIGPPESDQDNVVELTEDGRLRLPLFGLDLLAAGLTKDEAATTAAIVDLTRDADVVPMPREPATTGWRALADQAGALIGAYTHPRPTGEAGPDSLLPESAQGYAAAASTTSADVGVLAPLVPKTSRQAAEAADPHLEDDLAEWRDPDSRLPKLTLLGPVAAGAHGSVMTGEVPERRAYFTEIVAYLALHPTGVTSRQVCEAFGITASRARTDLAQVRQWFGTSPRTGTQHLPPANASPARAEHGTNGYQLHEVLVDFDLFRRLRVRAQTRGADGMSDLVAALGLVTGEPFSTLRQPGWSWLLDGERHHESAAFAVVDVAHLVATDAFARGDLDRARFAAETGCTAAPYDETCRLDLAKVAEAQGHTALAEQILDQHVFNRTDDSSPPIDLPRRSAQVSKNHNWARSNRSATK